MSIETCRGKNSKGKKCSQKRGSRIFPDEVEGKFCLYHVVQDPKNESKISCCQGRNTKGNLCSFHLQYPKGLVNTEELKYLKVSPYCRHHVAEGLTLIELDALRTAFAARFGEESSPVIMKTVLDFSGNTQVTPILWDLETTGLDFMENEIVEIAAKNVLTGETFHALVRPDGEIDPEASKIHGYYTKDLIGAPKLLEVFQRFLMFCLRFPNPILIAHYGKKFDVPLLNFEILRKATNFDIILSSLRFADSIEVFKKMLPLKVHPRHKPYCIQSLSNHFGYDREQTHQAFDDVDMLESILQKLKEKAGDYAWHEYSFRFDVKFARTMLSNYKCS